MPRTLPRFFHPQPLQAGQCLELTPEAARHVQVLRLQPGDALTLFGAQSDGGAALARVLQMGRRQVQVQIEALQPGQGAATRTLHLALAMPANERSDWLVEKVTELGAASIQPLLSERSVLRPSGERAEKKRAHWQAVAVSACEQCGTNRVPPIHPLLALGDWLAQPHPAAPDPSGPASPPALHAVLSLQADSQPWRTLLQAACAELGTMPALHLVAGPEGGFSPAEEQALRACGYRPVSLGPRVLRSETAALAALSLALLP